jgi:hypothetical protein
MPTPFTHLAVAQRLLVDEQLPASVRRLIDAERPAFLLGNIAADARISGNINREATHFFSYDRPIDEHPWRIMLAQHSSLRTPHSDAQRAFLVGYVAHLSMDELWSIEMVRPYFFGASWGDPKLRFLMLHIILIYMDERDYGLLADWQRGILLDAQPHEWTPFMDDATLRGWRDFIGGQIAPGISQTLFVFGERIRVPPEDLRAILDSPARMSGELWSNVAQSLLSEVEAHMYDHARAQMIHYCASENTA